MNYKNNRFLGDYSYLLSWITSRAFPQLDINNDLSLVHLKTKYKWEQTKDDPNGDS